MVDLHLSRWEQCQHVHRWSSALSQPRAACSPRRRLEASTARCRQRRSCRHSPSGRRRSSAQTWRSWSAPRWSIQASEASRRRSRCCCSNASWRAGTPPGERRRRQRARGLNRDTGVLRVTFSSSESYYDRPATRRSVVRDDHSHAIDRPVYRTRSSIQPVVHSAGCQYVMASSLKVENFKKNSVYSRLP